MRTDNEPARLHSGRASGRPLGPMGKRFAAMRQAGPGQKGRQVAQEMGRFFVDLRQAFRLSQAQIAKRLATRPEIVAALETGEVGSLPPWPETCRIVRAYTGLAGLDPRPVLRSIEMLLAVYEKPEQRRSKMPRLPRPFRRGTQARAPKEAGPRSPRDGAGRLKETWEGALGQAARAMFAVTIPVALVLLVTQTSVLEAAVAKLPPSVVRMVRGAQNYVIVQFAPVRDGMRWIDVPDPRTRRSDKLRTTAQSD